MAAEANQGVVYCIWAADNVVYGPVGLSSLIEWVKDERVLAETWVFDRRNDRWSKAARMPELQSLFPQSGEPAPPVPAPAPSVEVPAQKLGITPGMLRRVKALAELKDDQLSRFISFMEPQLAKPFAQIVKQGDHDDGMYLVLEGELRVRILIGGKETTLATLSTGDCFGEIALFDQGSRSADVIANTDSILLKVTTGAFDKLRREAPELSAPILFSISKTLASRIRADNKRTKESVHLARAAGH
ncbi:MAG: cyclic nucleotide-binding domain-containing protein [Limisphaerales bacterium]